ncbi:hydroxylamine reductase [Lachnotalea glycerini]|uniref:Hydroxylamine reductase n=2 Tax=Lachnotalea glycerini TaxID=1763509 RepID=A0A371JHW3_9FIRM|nr:hydroxylamine reductase [Lachnotalea glycerini]RDY32323.1 hydroxylamine reductase [Lachnotalea glycerini]
MKDMFCFQCQQTAHNTGCEGKAGVCGKKSDTANYQDALTGALIGLARSAKSGHKTYDTDEIVIKGLFTTITNVNFFNDTIKKLTAKIHEERGKINAQKYEDYDMECLWNDNEDIRSLKSLILFGLRGMAAYAYHAMVLGKTDDEVNQFFYEGLYAIGENYDLEKLLSLVLKTGEINFKCMELLDKANTEAYGAPVPTTVPLTIEKGPFIVVSGHDLYDLKLLLEQTKDKGINIYTHSEMLPAHGYPKLKAYSHLKGNFGTAWQSQQSEFHNIPAPILFTTNCLMPVRESYKDRVFTTSVVSYPELVHIGEDKDFTPIITKAIECGGYEKEMNLTGINKGSTVTTGFAHETVLGVADKIIQAVKDGKIRHFFLVGGCDGAAPGRSYYTDFVKQSPKDTIILTLACGKYRFNDLDIGEICGLPRILDMGQCNDAYSAIKVALALSKVFECSVNDLPLTLVLSWYEQKAVCILLTLLYLGIKNIYLGPTLPAFISPKILSILVDQYNITPISTPDKDLAKILG